MTARTPGEFVEAWPMLSMRVLDRTGISFRQLDHWCRLGLVIPEPRQYEKSGGSRRWSEREVRVLTVIARLVHAGLAPQTAAPIARRMVTDHRWAVDLGAGVTIMVTDPAQAVARSICEPCPVRAACAEHALARNEPGMWGGLTDTQRRNTRRRRNARAAS